MIVGAGLAGLIAAHAFPDQVIVERMPEPRELHKALLRFRTPEVGKLTGIEFRPVTVRKGIWMNNGWCHPSIAAANMYAQKVIGEIQDRSIWNLEPVTRYIAPPDFYERLVTQLRSRIEWASDVNFTTPFKEPVISTAPLPVMLESNGQALPCEFKRSGIVVRRYRVPNCDVHQTVYFPTAQHDLYRASITGDLLICEFSAAPGRASHLWMPDVERAFGLVDGAFIQSLESLGEVEQKYGKISPIDESLRKALVADLTQRLNVFSLGRFATWRNLLLDDLINDVAIIKRLINATHYERKLKSI